MKIFKFIILWIVLTVVMLVTWSIGFIVGNGITQSIPPPVDNPSSTGLSVLIVCLISSLLLSALVWSTRAYSGLTKVMALTLYFFVIPFFLAQMETFFFSESIGIAPDQIASILIAGFVMSVTTVPLGILISSKMNRTDVRTPFTFVVSGWRNLILPVILLAFLVYPLIYLTFGYYIAWQSESLRVYYTQSPELNTFFIQSASAFSDGIYFFQMLRGMIWVAFSIPVILMLQHINAYQYLLFGLLSALLPSVQLFIPNPYMPADIAMTHFFETSTSNFVWGLAITFTVNKYIRAGALQNIISV